jgi:hypothetical protein
MGHSGNTSGRNWGVSDIVYTAGELVELSDGSLGVIGSDGLLGLRSLLESPSSSRR